MYATRLAFAACGLAALALPAAASIPGNMEQRAREGLLHVCVDTEPADDQYVICTVQEDGADLQSPYTAAECEAAGLPVDPADLDPCTIDFIPKVKITGRLFLVHDEDALDGGSIANPNSEAAIVVELKKGGKKATFVELFDGTKIGNWNGFGEFLLPSDDGITYTNSDNDVFQFSNDNLTDLGLEIRELATGWFPKADLSAALPVLTLIERDPKRPPIDHATIGDTLASAATFKIVIQFARVRP
jgi:hypothetical protein